MTWLIVPCTPAEAEWRCPADGTLLPGAWAFDMHCPACGTDVIGVQPAGTNPPDYQHPEDDGVMWL